VSAAGAQRPSPAKVRSARRHDRGRRPAGSVPVPSSLNTVGSRSATCPLIREAKSAGADNRRVTIALQLGLALGLAAFCAVGWANTSRRLANARRKTPTPGRSYRAIEERVRLAEQTARFGTSAWDPVSQLFALSEGAAVISGLGNQPVEVTSAELYASVHHDDGASAKAVREQALVDGGDYVHEFRRVFPDGSVRWYRNHGHVELVEKAPQRVSGALMDITAEKQVLERLHQSAERMRLAETAASFGIWEMDLATGIVKGSEAWAALERVSDANAGRHVD
jgi:PAS domain-containing protein